jgi:hypothetical protein
MYRCWLGGLFPSNRNLCRLPLSQIPQNQNLLTLRQSPRRSTYSNLSQRLTGFPLR